VAYSGSAEAANDGMAFTIWTGGRPDVNTYTRTLDGKQLPMDYHITGTANRAQGGCFAEPMDAAHDRTCVVSGDTYATWWSRRHWVNKG
jgi:hypothetical protein